MTSHLYAPLGSLSRDEFLQIEDLPYYGDEVANLEDNGGAFVPEQVAQQFKEDNGVLVVYNYAEEHGFPESRLKTIASPGYFLTNIDDVTGSGVSDALCSANCFCQLGFSAFRVDDQRSTPTAGCYSSKLSPTTNPLATNRCKAEGGFVALAKTRNQTDYLDKKFATGSSFWIGLMWDQLYKTYKWADGSSLSPDEQPWVSSVAHQTGVDCVRVAPQGAELVWIASDCRQSFAYSCEVAPCDSETLCLQEV
ncbi:unnamed protein product [Heligmosomoides polygyrus]|uniref:C-type lectin domain-containing protein n=1 Tax=Heligmosomoides polygyrus TaxID=6339 RepID=A0A3P8BYS5_HELPZ|nr:unnamed protein product [Heligmosomoides polygyrus]